MSRFMLVVPPLAAHVNPAVAVARELLAGGHDVAWVGSEAYFRPYVGPDATVFPTGMRPYRGQRDRGAQAVKSLWEGFVTPFARAVLPAVEKAAQAFQPDVIGVDQHALAGALVAHRHGLPWASLAPTFMELTRPYRALPKVDAWMHGHMARLWDTAGMARDAGIDLRFSPHLVLAFTSPGLTGTRVFPDHFALVGPALSSRPATLGFPWEAVDRNRRLVLVTAGTLGVDLAKGLIARMVEALRPLAGVVQAVVNAPTDVVPDPPSHILVAPRVPVLELMPMLDGVVCHGGMGTVTESLLHGVPLVVAPIRYDQPMIADQIAAAGAGIRVRFGRATPDQLRTAVNAILDEPAYRVGATRVGEAFKAAGGAPAAARHLTQLAHTAR